jgi:putative tryptophan/tyrosine transport system substrate-binding protein
MLAAAGAAFAAAPFAGLAQAPARALRVAWLVPGSPPPGGGRWPQHQVLLERLRELGWTEGINLIVEFRYAQGLAEPLPQLAAELVASRPDVIVTGGTTSIRVLRAATAGVPIVMTGGGDPVGTGLVASLARPGGNITGVSLQGQEIIPKALSLLREVVPQAKRIDLLGNAANPGNAYFAKVFSDAARSLGIEGRLLEVRSADELEPAISGARADALLALPDPMFHPNVERMASTAIKRRLPLANSASRLYTAAGFLFSYSVNEHEVYRLAATYVDRILRGTRPAEMPIEQPTRYELVINQKTARAIGVTIPRSLLVSADEVIE